VVEYAKTAAVVRKVDLSLGPHDLLLGPDRRR